MPPGCQGDSPFTWHKMLLNAEIGFKELLETLLKAEPQV
jgi:hypothetical protein